MPVLALFLLPLTPLLEICRVGMAELVSYLIAIRFIDVGAQGQVAGATQGIFDPLRVDRPELVDKAKIDVVLKSRLACTMVLVRIERLHDVLLASLTVLGRRGQITQVDEEVLRPVFPILFRCRPVRVPVDPVADVLGKPLMELVEVLGDDEPVVPNISPVSDCERIGFAVFNRNICEIDRLICDCCGIALHGDSLSKGI
ncbi:MAG: hypothetical protein WBE55_20450 [Candidatus Sulfotelmatobacter sp.]